MTAAKIAAAVPDPELPMVTIADLGILRDVREDVGTVIVTITPTYSGCPAMREIVADLRNRLERAGYHHVDIRTRLTPPWTSDWITLRGRRKLAAAGIAPPAPTATSATEPTSIPPPASATSSRPPVPVVFMRVPVICPRCGSADSRETARFSGTPCKSLHRCLACLEPFEHIKEF